MSYGNETALPSSTLELLHQTVSVFETQQKGFTSKKDRRRFLCCPLSPICFRTLFFQFFGAICGFVPLLVIGSRILVPACLPSQFAVISSFVNAWSHKQLVDIRNKKNLTGGLTSQCEHLP
ncbi:hypothetical protein L1987_84139 [Smallanthus sonchifolius]|uniref:Uncharacterized protein n=1 Tax=Smallanthus sonchifolius TaxID=185202 RepID=A0ACB8YI34_9ASTR|nr:hypothetical protein L1987_84139 [Smallanthus sonchifolius]